MPTSSGFARPGFVALLAGAAALLPGVLARPARADDAPPTATPAESKAAEAKRAAALVDRMKSSDKDVRRAAFPEAKTVQHPSVTDALVHGLADPDEDVRRAAVAGLAARTEEAGKKRAALALIARLPRLEEKVSMHLELLEALRALKDLAQPPTVKPLADGLAIDIDPEQLAARLTAIANVPAGDAIEALIDYSARFGRGRRGGRAYQRRMVEDALQWATGERDVRNDPDAWRTWWKDHEKTFDHQAAAGRRAKDPEGGPKARPGDGEERPSMD